MQAAVSLAYQGVVVLNLLHCRLSCQGELDDLEVVQLLRGRSTARNKQKSSPSAHISHRQRGHAEMPGDSLKYRQAKCFTSIHFTAAKPESQQRVIQLAAADMLKGSSWLANLLLLWQDYY